MRTSGILLPVFSLPSRYGIGSFSKEAYEFIDRLEEAGQTYWQILPLGPTGYGDSPYQSFSAFAGNPYFIDLDTLKEQGLLLAEEYEHLCFAEDPQAVDYGKMYELRYPVLRKAFSRFDRQSGDFVSYCEREGYWLDDYSLFMAVKGKHQNRCWTGWEDAIRLREPQAIETYRASEAEEILFQKFLQYEFSCQWSALKDYANKKGIRIIGDIPIYVAFDGSDCWANQEMFRFDENHQPSAVAGCPPDAFSDIGQLWGNPLYDWEYHEKTGYAWWIRRMKKSFELYDVVRVDHFRGFDQYYCIPYGDDTAKFGHWEDGPGMKLFSALKENLDDPAIIAEDLGFLTDSVLKLVKDSGYPGMKVMEFAFDSRESGDYLPHNYDKNSVVYTGTHDNQTLKAWLDELTPQDYEHLMQYAALERVQKEEIVWAVIRLTLACVADTAIIPMQDYLCLGSEARINQPATLGTNWRWRLLLGQFDSALAKKIRSMSTLYGRNC
ncbi:MAG: 4-alpha-glucanotransferase [Eubacteriales bacterium]|nr:4-alpha-glucanotransferase [Eubacteriales bacterium]